MRTLGTLREDIRRYNICLFSNSPRCPIKCEGPRPVALGSVLLIWMIKLKPRINGNNFNIVLVWLSVALVLFVGGV